MAINRVSFKIDPAVLSRLRKIAKREGWLLTRLIERLIESGIRAENLK